MKLSTHTLIFFLLVTILSVISQAQNSLTHNTGTLEVTIIDNGYIGDDTTHTYGGIVFNGNQNALYIAGLIFGQYGQGYGNVYKLFSDFYNVVPLYGFNQYRHFDQHSFYTAGTTLDPNIKIEIESFSGLGDDFIILRTRISNNYSLIDDLYPGIFADWDVGNNISNRGGYDLSRNLFYTYERESSADTSFYGIMGIAIDSIPMIYGEMKGMVTDSVAWNRMQLYQYMTSTAFDTITTDAEYRTFVCVGPVIINAGTTKIIDFAFVAGRSLSDLIANADAARSYLIPLGILDDKPMPINYLLYQNYPNPFNPSTKIKYTIPTPPVSSPLVKGRTKEGFVTLKVYDILGREIATLVNAEKPAGKYEVEFSASNLPSGIYFYQLKAGQYSATKKMVLLK